MGKYDEWRYSLSSGAHQILRVCLQGLWAPFALLKAKVSLQLGKVFSSDNGVSVSIMYSYMY